MGEQKITTNQLYDLIKGLITSNEQIKEQITLSKEDIKGEIYVVRDDLAKELQKIKQENNKLIQENQILKERLKK